MIQNKNVISPIIPFVTSAFGIFIAFALISLAVMSTKNEQFTFSSFISTGMKLFLQGGSGVVSVFLLLYVVRVYFALDYEELKIVNPALALVILLAAGFLESFVVALFAQIALKSEKKLDKGFLKLLFGTLLFFIATTVIPETLEFIPSIFIWTYKSMPSKVAGIVLVAMLQWLAIQKVFFMFSNANDSTIDRGVGNTSKPRIMKTIVSVIGILVLITLSVATVLPTIKETSSDIVMNQIEDLLVKGDSYLTKGNLMSAASCYNYANTRYEAWKVVLSKKGSLFSTVKELYNDTAVQLLEIDANASESMPLIYSFILTSDCPVEYYIYYLDRLDDLELDLKKKAEASGSKDPVKLDDILEERRKDLLLYLILNDVWSGKVVLQGSFDEQQSLELLKELEQFDEDIAIRKSVITLSQLVANGGILSKEIVEGAIILAQEYPESIYLQELAMELGAAYTYDSGTNFYEEAAVAALRYDALYTKENPNASDEEKIIEKQIVAIALMKCHKHEEAKKLLEDTISRYNEPALQIIYASVLYRNNEFLECAMLTESLISDETCYAEALGLAMISRLMNGDVSESLEHALLLSETVQNGEYLSLGDSFLFTYAQAISGANIGDKQVSAYSKRYNIFSNEDKLLLEKDPFLNNLILAFTTWQGGEFEKAEVHIEAALGIRQDLAYLHYLKGAIYFEQKEYEVALDSFLKSVSINRANPAAWFMLGHVYDRMELYPESENAFNTVLEFLPFSDHDIDHYGLAYHSREAIYALQKYITKEVES